MDIKFAKALKILNLQKNATLDDIKNSYRQLVKIHHPDLYSNEENKIKATKNFKVINEAYEYLKTNYISPDKRDLNSNSDTKSKHTDKNNQAFTSYSKDKNDNLINLIKQCINTRAKIKIKYRTSIYYGGKFSERTIIPLDLFLGKDLKHLTEVKYNYDENKIYLVAYCELRKNKRTFRLDRIISAQILKKDNNKDADCFYQDIKYNSNTEFFKQADSTYSATSKSNFKNTNQDYNIGCLFWIVVVIIVFIQILIS